MKARVRCVTLKQASNGVAKLKPKTPGVIKKLGSSSETSFQHQPPLTHKEEKETELCKIKLNIIDSLLGLMKIQSGVSAYVKLIVTVFFAGQIH